MEKKSTYEKKNRINQKWKDCCKQTNKQTRINKMGWKKKMDDWKEKKMNT